ncbi:plasma serine protease inhibitor-like [Apodemus sylvaticus]|uniref:plasma serine protease inhibitor-like n=1 Tax=Apodemus sylvaticus TaxID=10129 RepID=UPI002244668A|nr:plasma serine protease inhibitor-like [Apodemus sylvaticus]
MRFFPILCLVLFFSHGMASRQRLRFKEKKKAKESTVGAVGTRRGGNFAINLFKYCIFKKYGENIFFSPVSVAMNLGMLSLGARSKTKTQILDTLGVDLQQGQENKLHQSFQQLLQRFSHPSDGLELSLGSAIFKDPAVHIRGDFLNAMKTLYMSDILSTNFGNPESAKKQINDYVTKQTKGKIVDLIKDLDRTHVMVVVNYIFFKGKWQTAFSEKNTRKMDFHVTPKKTIQVPMMNREDEYSYIVDQIIPCTVVGIPYQGSAVALFILPNEGKMKQVEDNLDERILRNWLKMSTKRRLDLYLPKFSIEGTYKLEKILPKLGIQDLFTTHADLSGITNHTNIKLSEMVHKAMVEVDELGTTAAATTGAIFTFRSALPSSQKVEFIRPFLMAIMDGVNLFFLGKVVQP